MRASLSAKLCLLLIAPVVSAAEASFVEGPAVERIGGGVKIRFSVSCPTDDPATAAPTTQPADPLFQPLNPKLPAMGDNRWLDLKPKGMASARMYSGCCFGGGHLWYFGGAYHYKAQSRGALLPFAHGQQMVAKARRR